jgi:Ni/Co efflux regulator RcnB
MIERYRDFRVGLLRHDMSHAAQVPRRIIINRFILSALALSMAATAGLAMAESHDHQGRDDHRSFQHSDRGYARGWSTRSEWRRGGRVGRDDWGRGRAVDYRAHHLRAPPRGYAWRDVGGRYVLAAVASGVIADIILNNR